MPLTHDLTRVPFQSLDVLRYMGQQGIRQGTTDELEAGTGMSNRLILKAIRGLVTKGYLIMDAAYVYHLTEKGTQAIQEIAEHDAEQAAMGGQQQSGALLQRDLIVVTPNALPAQRPTPIQVGWSGGSGTPLSVVLRLSALGGQVSPAQLDLDMQGGEPTTVQVTPNGDYDAVRIRIEALQLIGDADFHDAGGIFFDLPLGQGSGQQAWYGELTLRR